MNEALLKQFVGNKEVYNAVREFIIIYGRGKMIALNTRKYSNENLGQLHRGMSEGIDLVNEAFREMEKYREGRPAQNVPMQGR